MRIQNNIPALNSHRQLGTNNGRVAKNLEKLSSGYRINRAGDDAAGLAISEKMRAQITGLKTASKNANDGISLVQTAEGALTEVHSMLNRMVELADQSANGTYDNDVDRNNLQKEIKSLSDEIDRISKGTNFNGIKLLDGSIGAGKSALSTTTGFVPGSDFGVGGANVLTGFKVTGISGTNLDSAVKFSFDIGAVGANGAWAADPAGTMVQVKSTGADGAVTVTMMKVEDVFKKADGSKIDNTAAGGIGKGENVIVDLSAVGIGKITLNNATGNAVTSDALKSLGAALKTAAGVESKAPTGVPAGGGSLTLQIGDTADSFNKLQVKVGNMSSAALGLGGLDISNQTNASDAVAKIKSAINTVSSTRGDLGAVQNRLEHTINNLGVTTENMTAAESRIRDVDMAEEMMAFTKNNILTQSSQAMLAQANQVPQGVLQLLQ